MASNRNPNSDELVKNAQDDRGRQLTQSDWKLVEQWENLGSAFGIPKSVSRIYGLMFVSPDALSAKDCVDYLQISRSSAGQGIHLLLDLGAIKPVFEIGKREDSYVVEPDLGVLIRNVLQGRFMPTIEQFINGLEAVRQLSEEEGNENIKSRLNKLERWQSKLAPFKYWLEQQI